MKAGFLQAICDEPDDDTHRLIYADWLEDNGEPDRAEFIRVQCALARMEMDDPEADSLRQREGELLKLHERTWRAELPVLPEVTWSSNFYRGFVDWAGVRSPTTWRAFAPEILRAIPLRGVSMPIKPNMLRQLARSREITRIRGLHFPKGYFEDTDLEVLARTARLREFSYAPNNNSARTLGENARHIFATMPGFAGLRDLSLNRVPFGNAGAARLAGAPNLSEIVSLRLHRCQVTSLGVGAIANHAGWPRLRSLDLSNNYIDDHGCRAIASSPGLGELRALDLSNNNITGSGATALARSMFLRNITGSGATALARSMFLRRLQNLNLAGCSPGEDGIEALATSSNLASLRSLSLEFTGITARDALTLLRSPLAQNLRWLNLRGVMLDGDAVTDLTNLADLDGLQTLLLSAGLEDDRLRERFGDRVQFV